MNLHKIKSILFLSATMLAVTACNDADEPMAPAAQSVTFNISESAFGPESRASDQGYMTGFTAGDACGLYIVRNGNIACSNVKLTAAESEGSLIWQAETPVGGGLPDESYYLYYPYQSDMEGKVDAAATDAAGFFAPLVSGWQPAADQSTYADYTASDLMTAQGTASKRSDGTLLLSFSMTHRMSLAVIEMPKTVYKFTDASIPDYTAGTSADFTASDIQPYAIAPGTYRCIVNPASGSTTSLAGSYAGGKKEFAITPSAAQGSYKTYKIDGLTPIEKQAILKMGDYFCKNSDNNWYIIPQEAAPDDKVIGIVFYAGQHDTDTSDYTSTGIGQAQCHGYIVALTDVHNGNSDRLRWEWGLNQQYDQRVNTSTSTSDWQGYSNSLKFHEFVEKNTGWEMKHFPAALACEIYGNRTTDQDGNPANGKYDWQKPLVAPSNTSGWFLPSCGQLQYLYQNRSVLSARMTDVKNSTPTDCRYKDKIKWFSRTIFCDYWSSTEYSSRPNSACHTGFNDYAAYPYADHKDYTCNVRAVLAF